MTNVIFLVCIFFAVAKNFVCSEVILKALTTTINMKWLALVFRYIFPFRNGQKFGELRSGLMKFFVRLFCQETGVNLRSILDA